MRLHRLRGASLAVLACVALTACATTGSSGSNSDGAASNDGDDRVEIRALVQGDVRLGEGDDA